jgi:hypothetical protein
VKRILLSLALAVLIVAAYSLPAGLVPASVQAQSSGPESDIPAYHAGPPAPGQVLPPILHGRQLSGPYFRARWQVVVYKEAAKIPDVLYQLPCYCRCDRELGHTSLRSCYEGLHAAMCATCAEEGAYAYKMTRLGWTPLQIRKGIEEGQYESINLNKLGATDGGS